MILPTLVRLPTRIRLPRTRTPPLGTTGIAWQAASSQGIECSLAIGFLLVRARGSEAPKDRYAALSTGGADPVARLMKHHSVRWMDLLRADEQGPPTEVVGC